MKERRKKKERGKKMSKEKIEVRKEREKKNIVAAAEGTDTHDWCTRNEKPETNV